MTYAAVGATSAADFLRFPPSGFRSSETVVRLGHGEQRWRHAWTQTLSWGIQTRAGLRVDRVDAPPEVHENSYVPVAFDADREPVRPAALVSDEAVYADSGIALVRAGDSAILTVGGGPLALRVPVRVVWVIDEPTRCGFACGTLPGSPDSGEQSFVVERRDDGSVWLAIRTMVERSRPGQWLRSPVTGLIRAILLSRYEHALGGPL